MREIRKSGLMSGEGRRGVAEWPKLPRSSSTLQFGFSVGEMNVRVYHVIIAYGFLWVSVLTFVISLLVSVLALIDVLFRVGFGYPRWSIAVGVALAALGFLLIKASPGYLKMVKRQDV